MNDWNQESNFKFQVATALIVVLFAVTAANFASTQESINPINGCTERVTDDQNTFAFLIDTTDDFSEVQQRKIERKIQSLLVASQERDRFQIYLINASGGELLAPIFDRCIVASESGVAPILQKLHDIKFDEELKQAFEFNFGSSRSPIIQSIDSVVTSLPVDQSRKTLLVVSDFYENSALLSHYNHDWRNTSIKDNPRLAARMPDLRNVEVHLMVIARENLIQDSDLVQWWIDLIEAAGGIITTKQIGEGPNLVRLLMAERITG